VPTYNLTVDVPSAAQLVKGNEVRIGGDRVGVISAIKPQAHSDGSVTAQLVLHLETSIRPLPADSTVEVRPRSALGLKYVEINRGHSRSGFKDGGVVPLLNATPKPVEIDQFFNMFDKRTRAAQRVGLREFGDALAGRGQSLHTAIFELNPLLGNLTPVLKNIVDPKTRFSRFFPGLERLASVVAPVAEQQAGLFRGLATTFTALQAVAPSIQQTIVGGPPALDQAIHSLPIQRPFLQKNENFFAGLRPGVHALSAAAPQLANAFTVGTPALQRAYLLNQRIGGVFQSLQRFSQDPAVPIAFKDLTQTTQLLDAPLTDLVGAQVTCNYVSTFFRNFADLLTEGDATHGTWMRFNTVLPFANPRLYPNSEALSASAPANGATSAATHQEVNSLHSNPYPYVAGLGQPKACGAGNEGYVTGPSGKGKLTIGNTALTTKHDGTTAQGLNPLAPKVASR
jgi:ABC-type transporter Mla subunit MlaD